MVPANYRRDWPARPDRAALAQSRRTPWSCRTMDRERRSRLETRIAATPTAHACQSPWGRASTSPPSPARPSRPGPGLPGPSEPTGSAVGLRLPWNARARRVRSIRPKENVFELVPHQRGGQTFWDVDVRRHHTRPFESGQGQVRHCQTARLRLLITGRSRLRLRAWQAASVARLPGGRLQ